MTEQRLQQECFMWHWNTYPDQRGLLFRIKNEGTNRISGARGKATGIIPGVADMCLLVPKEFEYKEFYKYTTVFIEFKSEKGKQSKSQKEWQQLIEKNGFLYYIINSFNKFKELCQELDL